MKVLPFVVFTLLLMNNLYAIATQDSIPNVENYTDPPNNSNGKELIVRNNDYNLSKISSRTAFTFYTDQDFLYPSNNTDQNYTMGVNIGLTNFISTSNFEKKCITSKNIFLFLPFIRKNIDNSILKLLKIETQGSLDYSQSLNFRVSAFTPLIIDSLHPIIGDRPFASLISLSSSKFFHKNSGKKLIKNYAINSSFTIGVLGTRLAEKVQTYIHENHWFGSTRPVPTGWPNQISDKKYEPTALYYFNVVKPIFQLAPLSIDTTKVPYLLQLTGNLETMLGYYTNIAPGFTLRIGKITDEYYDSNDNASTIQQLGYQGKNNNLNAKSHTQLYFYFKSRIRGILYNALLQGQFAESNYTMTSDQINNFILEFEFGINVNYDRISINFIPLSLRTSEIKGIYSRTHTWGSVYFNIKL